MVTVIKTPPFRTPLLPPTTAKNNNISLKSPKSVCLSFRRKPFINQTKHCPATSLRFSSNPFQRLAQILPFAFHGETETETSQTEHDQQTIPEPEFEDSSDGAAGVGDAASEGDDDTSSEEVTDSEDASSVILASLQSYKEAITSNEQSRIAEIEAFLKSIEDEKIEIERKVATLIEELSIEKDRVLRISADFDNFRKRTDRERLSLVENAQGELVESLLPIMDSFERAKAHIKAETEGEQKINNSYQSIYKQFIETLASLGVVPVETTGSPFDPMLHEAIMREDSAEFEEGVIIQEFRKGFKLGDKLLRPSMVKVSAGPGPAKPEQTGSSQETETAGETSEEGSSETESAE